MKTIKTQLTWPDGATVVITGCWQNKSDDAPLVYEGATDRLAKLMPFLIGLPQSFRGRSYAGLWDDIAQYGGLKIETTEEGDWITDW